MNLPISDGRHVLSRRTFIAGATAVTGVALGGLPATAQTTPTSVSGAPNLPAGFATTFTSRYVRVNGIRLHAVVGGSGRPLLLVHGWPEYWYAWRLLMPALARDFQVVAVDQRGMGLSDKPRSGYDAGTVAGDLVALMDALGHQRFSVVGHDTGMVISYALAADHPDRVDRLAVAEAPLPGIGAAPTLFEPTAINDRIWHIAFNRTSTVNEQLVRGREDIFFGYEFTTSAAKKLPEHAVRHYIQLLAASPDALRGSFEFYRALDTTLAQNRQRANRKLTMPVLAIGGQASLGTGTADTMKLVANNVQTAVIDGAGHFVAEEAPERMLAALTPFLAQ